MLQHQPMTERKLRAAAAAGDIGLKEESNYANKMNAPEGFCSRPNVLAYFCILFLFPVF